MYDKFDIAAIDDFTVVGDTANLRLALFYPKFFSPA